LFVFLVVVADVYGGGTKATRPERPEVPRQKKRKEEAIKVSLESWETMEGIGDDVGEEGEKK